MTVKSNRTVSFISLGCAKNRVDTEHMLGIVTRAGYVLVDEPDDADFAVINTCGFLESAVEEAIDTILETAALKTTGRLKKLVVTGCFVQRYGYKLAKNMPEVDGWLGTGEIPRIAELLAHADTRGNTPFFICRPDSVVDHEISRLRTTPFYSAYLKVAEGCSHRCSYCIIPGLRGPLRSRTLKSLVMETRTMAAEGVKEINLIAQDTTLYGRDLEPQTGIEDLLESLIPITGIEWIRLLYCHPNQISDRLLTLIESEEKICPYVDLPFQHVNKNILRAMKRDPLHETPFELIERIRSLKRPIRLRTSLMVGFPGETDAMHEELIEFVNMARFDHLGVFVFSPEKGTAAAAMKQTVSAEIAKKRQSEIMAIQADISKSKNQDLIGQTLSVLIEGKSPETDLLLKGRTAFMAPDVDGQVLINEGEGIMGKIMDVRIIEAHEYDLIGKIVDTL